MSNVKFFPSTTKTKSDLIPKLEYESTQDSVKITINFPGFAASSIKHLHNGRTVTFDQLKIPTAGYLSVDGKPLLPVFGKYIQIQVDT